MTMPRAGVLIPAHDEESVLERGLSALLDGTEPGALRVLVVANGCTDGTARVAREFAAREGHAVEVIEVVAASKAGALRAGAAHMLQYPRIVLDADVELRGEVALALAEVLSCREPRVAAPQLAFETSDAPALVQRYYRVWALLPYARLHSIGSGVYAFNEAGAERLGALPDVTNDDGYVRRCFSEPERVLVDGEVLVRVPRSTWALVSRRARVALGNEQLEQGLGTDSDATSPGDLLELARTRSCSPVDLLAFAAVTITAKFLAAWRKLRRARGTWSQDRTTRSTVTP